MPERASVYEAVQLGVETTPGTGVAANKKLQAVGITPAVQAETEVFRPVGGKFPTISYLNREWVQTKIAGVPAYNDLAYLLSGLIEKPTPVQQGGTAAYLWTFEPAQAGTDTPATYTVEAGSSTRAGKFTYGLVRELNLRVARDSIELSGEMIGREYQDGITMTASPTEIAVVPLTPGDVNVYMDTTSGGIGTTKLTRVLRAEFGMSDRYAPVWVLDSTLDSYAAHVETPPEATLKLLVEADATGMGPLTALRNGERRYLRLRSTGPLIASTYYYQLTVDLCGMVTDVGEFSDEDGVYAVEWTFRAIHDSGWGKALTIALINTLAAL